MFLPLWSFFPCEDTSVKQTLRHFKDETANIWGNGCVCSTFWLRNLADESAGYSWYGRFQKVQRSKNFSNDTLCSRIGNRLPISNFGKCRRRATPFTPIRRNIKAISWVSPLASLRMWALGHRITWLFTINSDLKLLDGPSIYDRRLNRDWLFVAEPSTGTELPGLKYVTGCWTPWWAQIMQHEMSTSSNTYILINHKY